jgi:hypothetical protein
MQHERGLPGQLHVPQHLPFSMWSLNAGLALEIDVQNMQYVAGWLQIIGISNIQTLLGILA